MTLRTFDRSRMAAWLLAGSALATLGAPAAMAQNAPEGMTEAEQRGANEIVVTAQRRAERLEDVPMSIAALPADALAKAAVFDFDNLTRATTGIRIARTGVFTQPGIRGISTANLGPGQENNVATYVDGFYQPDQLTLSGDLVGISNVQILKGPQGTLYGRNATGGAILINTLDPSTDEIKGNVQIGYARYDDRRAQGTINVPLSDSIAFNVVANYRSSDSYIRDITGDYPGSGARAPTEPPYKHRRAIGYIKDWGVRAKLRAELTPDLTVTLAYRHRFFTDNRATSFFMTDYPALPQDPGIGFGIGGYDYVAASVPNINDINLDEGSAKIEFKTGIGTLTSYTSYTDQKVVFLADYDGTKFDYFQSGALFPRKTFQQAVDFNIDTIDRLNLVVGGHYYHDNARGGTDSILLGGLIGAIENQLKTDAFAVFADATYDLTDQLHVTIGGRYSRERKSFSSQSACCGTEGPLFPDQPRKATFSNFTPRVVVRYEVADRTNVYASWSRGFKSGTFNSVGGTPGSVDTPPVDPETISAYEVGFKMVRDKFRFEGSAYYYDYKNLQLQRLNFTTLPDGSASVDTILENAASAEIYGAELSLNVQPTDGLNLDLAVNYNHARYKDFPDGVGAIPIGGVITNVPQDFSGQRIPRAPDWTVNIAGDYTVPIGDSNLNFSGSLFFSSEYTPTSPSYDPVTGRSLYSQPAYVQVNAGITWRSPGDRFEIGAYVNNIFNERYRIWYNPTAFGAWYVLSEPTVWGLRAGVNF